MTGERECALKGGSISPILATKHPCIPVLTSKFGKCTRFCPNGAAAYCNTSLPRTVPHVNTPTTRYARFCLRYIRGYPILSIALYLYNVGKVRVDTCIRGVITLTNKRNVTTVVQQQRYRTINRLDTQNSRLFYFWRWRWR